MSEWKSFEVPKKFIGESRETGNNYIMTSQTEILLPKGSEYAGYCFWHPSKLVRELKDCAEIAYTDEFTFQLVKKDREPGKRYRRYMLNSEELLAVYASETTRLKDRREKKEQARLSQTGTVVIALYREPFRDGGFMTDVSFRYNGRRASIKDACWLYEVEQISTRGQFEAAEEQLTRIIEEYHMLLSVRFLLAGSKKQHSERSTQISSSFAALCEQWEKEFFAKVSKALSG